MENFNRLTILCGHYGSGKTNVAVNIAFALRKVYDSVTVADLDIVNPYFRTKDSSDEFKRQGIRLISSEFANSNVDLPAMPPDMYSIVHDRRMKAVVDVGGDDRGALALGRLAPMVKEEGDYQMLMVINKFRPLTPDALSTVEVLREIESACGIGFTGLVNNSNLGAETSAGDVLASVDYAAAVSELSGLPVVMTTVKESLYDELQDKIPDLFPLKLQQNPLGFWN